MGDQGLRYADPGGAHDRLAFVGQQERPPLAQGILQDGMDRRQVDLRILHGLGILLQVMIIAIDRA